MILRLALPSTLRRLFDYRAPTHWDAHTLQPGIRLRVPFGRRELVGILVETAEHSDIPPERLREPLAQLDSAPIITPALLQLCQWTARYYQHGLGDTLATALPSLLRKGEMAEHRRTLHWQATDKATPDAPTLQRAPRQQAALRTLLQHPQGLSQEQIAPLGLERATLTRLVEKGLLHQQSRPLHAPRHQGCWLLESELPLNEPQKVAFQAIQSQLHHFQPFLLAGVTGSGKTEIYLQLIHQVLEQGRQALVLIPEINLGPQTLERFQRRFNARIVICHSGLTERARLDIWLAARDGHADIVIGTRSALFIPLIRPGLIIVDEEHDLSYKQQEGLRYHARDLALVRAHQENLPIVLGSATPSLESLHNAQQGRYGLLTIGRRAGAAKPPRLERLDIKSRPLDSGLSEPLQRRIGQTLAAGHQVLVFLNRRGFAPTLLCHDCGWVASCSRCDARMTLHQNSKELRCHHCGYTQPRPKVCPQCQKVDLRPLGAGTERLEERLNRLFPKYPVLRIDRDTTARKGHLEALLQTIHSGQPCILLGTQMLAKGHHFPQVALVAILDADGGLFSSDFRAGEYMAQQILQVAGRAGRAEQRGTAIIQTHQADHPLLVQLTEQGYFAFAEQALADRRAADWPPFSHLALLRAEAHDMALTEAFLEQAYQLAEQLQPPEDLELLGPVPAPMERRAGRYRAQLLLLARSRASLHGLLTAWLGALEQLPNSRRVRWSLDVDPVDLF